MISNKTNFYYVGFAIVILLVVNHIRSGVLVDTSFLPRFFLLTLLLLFTTVGLFRNKTTIRVSFVEVAFLLLYLWSLVSSLWATVPSEAIVQSQLIFISFSVYLVITGLNARNSRFEGIFIRIALLAMLFTAGLAFYKMSKLEFFDPYRIISVSANNNLYAGYLLICLPLALAGYSRSGGWWKYLAVAVGTLAVFLIVITQSRAVYLGLLAATLIMMVLLLARYRSLVTRKNLLVAAVALVLLSAGIFAFYSSLDQPRKNYFLSKIPVWQYFRSYDDGLSRLLEKQRKEKASLTGIPEFDFAGSYYENANLRVIFWKKSACLVAAHPFLGVGAGNWRINVASYPKPVNPDHTLKNYTYSQPHNEWIGFVSELVIPGLLFAIILFFLPVITVLFRLVSGQVVFPASTLFYTAFLAGFYLYACFDFPMKRIEHNVMLFSILAFMWGNVPLKSWSFKITGHAVKYIWLCLTGGLLFTGIVVSMRISGEFYTLRMFANEGKNYEKVILNGRKASNLFYRLTPNTLPLDWFIGVAQFRLGNPEPAKASFLEALKVTPFEVRVKNDYATALYQLGRVPEAKSELQKTLVIDPFFDDARFNLGAIYYFTGHRDSALYCIRQCRNSQKKTDFQEELGKEDYPQ